jgi:sigma-E factor negative regulatory protein RseB
MTGGDGRLRLRRFSGVLASFWLVSLAAAEAADPHELLDRMNDAVRELDYEGRFVVQSGDQLDALYIVHRVVDGAEKERVVALTGQAREIVRSGEAVACLVSGSDRHINVGRRSHGRSVSPLRGVSSEHLGRSYSLSSLAPAQVAGREAHQILIQPNDDLRYGYRLFVDKLSALPLRSMVLDAEQNIVSQVMFVELRVTDDITPIEYDLSAMQRARSEQLPEIRQERLLPPAWSFSSTPPGFQLNAHRRRPVASAVGSREHFIFSDGLATVSVYVQPLDGSGMLPGRTRFGAANMLGKVFGEHEVIAVGEVPTKTLNLFVNNIRAAGP